MAEKPISLARMGMPTKAPKTAAKAGKSKGHPHSNLGKWLHPPKGGK